MVTLLVGIIHQVTKLAFNSSNNINSTGILFYGKKLYYRELLSHPYRNYIDLWYNKPLYGKVDKEFNVVHVSSANLKLINDGMRNENIYALNFVADAFNAMKRYLSELETRKKILPDSFFHPLKAYKGWQGVNLTYKNQLDVLYRLFINEYLSQDNGALGRQIETFDDFLPIFKDYLNLMTNRGLAFTKSGFISKVSHPHASSGLIIEIADGADASNDPQKYFKYFSDGSFDQFAEITKQFGFYIDMNMPWRLVANLESPAWQQNPILKKIIDNYFKNDYTSQSVFDKYYHKAHEADLGSLKIMVMQFFNSYVARDPSYRVPEVCNDVFMLRKTYRPAKKVFQRIVDRRKMTMEKMDMKYSDLFWLRLYTQIRLKEMEIDISKNEVANLLREIGLKRRSHGLNAAMEHISETMATFLREQVSKNASLRLEQKNLLTNGQAPDIIL